jgi:hypothetical protein
MKSEVKGTVTSKRLGNTGLYKWTEKLKNGPTSIMHEGGAGCPSTATTDNNIERVRDMVLSDRLIIDEVANHQQIMKNEVIVSFLFLLK